jgi:hypothetical protein
MSLRFLRRFPLSQVEGEGGRKIDAFFQGAFQGLWVRIRKQHRILCAGSGAEIMPVVQIDGRCITDALRQQFAVRCHCEGVKAVLQTV